MSGDEFVTRAEAVETATFHWNEILHLRRRTAALEGDAAKTEQQYACCLQQAGYRKVPSVKNDPRMISYWQRWEGPGEFDWFEFPHDLPLDLVWDTISGAMPR